MKKFFESLFTGLIIIVMIWGEFGGLYHTYTRHRDQFWLAVFVPPISWYYGVELLWHKEYSGKRWEKTLNSDSHMIVYLINASGTKDFNKAQLANEADSFSIKISKYPKHNQQIIRSVFDSYVRWLEALYDEYAVAMLLFIETGTYKLAKSNKTEELEKTLAVFGLEENIVLTRKYMDSLTEALPKEASSKWTNLSDSEKQLIKESASNIKLYLDLGKQTVQNDLRVLSKKIFD